ncbi:MAG: T9SS type A sorting domain-containing protein [Bacteroidia bacterium]
MSEKMKTMWGVAGFRTVMLSVFLMGISLQGWGQLPWTADFENTAGNNAWTTKGSGGFSGSGTLAGNNCYAASFPSGSGVLYFMNSTTANQCAGGTYPGGATYMTPLAGNGSACMYTEANSGGNQSLWNYWGFNNTNVTSSLVSPTIVNTHANVNISFLYLLNTPATCTAKVFYSTAGTGGPWTVIGILTPSATSTSFSSTFVPGAVNFNIKIEYEIGASSGLGGTFEFDNVLLTFAACAAPTAQPTALVLSNIHASTITGNFTASAPAADGYLVVRTTSAVAPTNPVLGTTYVVGAVALGGVIVATGSATTFTAYSLTGSTQYWFWVYSFSNFCLGGPTYLTAAPLSNNATTIAGRYWVGVGAGGGAGATDFNTAANWSPAGVPGAAEEADIIFTTTAVTSTPTITLSASVAIGSLYMLSNQLTGATLSLDAKTKTLTINGALTTDIIYGADASSNLSLRVGNSPGNIIVTGTATLGSNANINSNIEFNGSGSANSTGTITFKGDVNFGPTFFPTTGNSIGAVIWDGLGAQTITGNNVYPAQIGGPCQIGGVNTPTVTVSSGFTQGLQVYPTGKNLTINTGCTLDLTTNTWNSVSGGAFLINGTGTLKLAGSSGGFAGNNFPNFSSGSEVLSATSTVIYNSANGVNQTVYSTPNYGNLTLTNSTGAGATTKTPDGGLTMLGNFTNNSFSTFVGVTYTHKLAGNFTNNGTFTANTSTFNFNGGNAQSIGGSSSTFYNLRVNNSAILPIGISQTVATQVSNIMTLSVGIYNLNGNTLTLTNSATGAVTAGSATTYIVSEDQATGNMASALQWNIGNAAAASSYSFPFGYGGNYIPFTFLVTTASGDPTTTITLATYECTNGTTLPLPSMAGQAVASTTGALSNSAGCFPNAANNSNLQVNRYWEITAGGTAPTATITFSYLGSENKTLGTCGGGAGGLLAPQRWDVAQGQWGAYNGGGTFIGEAVYGAGTAGVTAGVGAVSITGVNKFSPWTLVSKSNPLPVDLLSFTATANTVKKEVDLNWAAASETNNHYFTVERTKDGSNYEFVARVNGAGNSSEPLSYKAVDPDPFTGTSYYRLTQTDYNGNYRYYGPVAINLDASQNFEVYPNPSSGGDLMMRLKGQEANKGVLVVLYNTQGQQVYSKVILTGQSGDMIEAIDPSNTLAAGVYVVMATSQNDIYKQKIIIK